MYNKTVIGVFDDSRDAEKVIRDLEKTGFDRDEIRFISKDATGEYAATYGHGMRGGTAAGTAFDIIPDLEARGVPREDAEYFSRSIQLGKALVLCSVGSDAKADKAVDIMLKHGAKGPIAGEMPAATELREGMREEQMPERERMREREFAERGETMPVVEEELKVGKRQVEHGRVRIYQRVTERPVEADVKLREERTTVERRPVDRPATEADLRERVVEVRETGEEPVVAKEPRVVEEVEIGKETTERTEKIKDTVRRKDVEIEEEKKKPE